jgi:Uma2 family endonuclease
MTTALAEASVKSAKKPRSKPVPEYLIYEEFDGIPLYYAGYEQVLKNKKTLEDIMGYGSKQWVLLDILANYFRSLVGEKYRVLQGEGGLHLSHRTNLSLDLAIFERSKLAFEKLEDKYFDFPPKVIIEVDTKAHAAEFVIPNYYQRKTQRLLDFGVEQVIWVFTDPRKITVAQNEGPWLTVNWNENIEVMGHTLNLQSLIDQLG